MHDFIFTNKMHARKERNISAITRIGAQWPQKYPPLWQEVTLIFALSRLGIVLVTVVAIALFSQYSQLIYVPDVVDVHYQAHDLWSYLYAWWRWDAVHLTKIAAYGYQHDRGSTAFLPLFPLLQRGVGDVLCLILQPSKRLG